MKLVQIQFNGVTLFTLAENVAAITEGKLKKTPMKVGEEVTLFTQGEVTAMQQKTTTKKPVKRFSVWYRGCNVFVKVNGVKYRYTNRRPSTSKAKELFLLIKKAGKASVHDKKLWQKC